MKVQEIYKSISITGIGVILISSAFYLSNIIQAPFKLFKGESLPNILPGELHAEGLTLPEQNNAGDFFINVIKVKISYPKEIIIDNAKTVVLEYERAIHIVDDSPPNFEMISRQPLALVASKLKTIPGILTSQQVKGVIPGEIPPSIGPELDSTTEVTIKPSQRLTFQESKVTPITYQWYIEPEEIGEHYLLLNIGSLYSLDKLVESNLEVTLNNSHVNTDEFGIVKMPFTVYTIWGVSRKTVEVVRWALFAIGGVFLVTGISRIKFMEVIMSNTGDTYNVGQAGAVGKYARSYNNTFYQSEQKQTLAEAATEIQQLLKDLEESNSTITEEEKIAYVNDGITPSLKQRVVGALQAGSESAIEEFLDNPYINVGKAIVKGWIKPE